MRNNPYHMIQASKGILTQYDTDYYALRALIILQNIQKLYYDTDYYALRALRVCPQNIQKSYYKYNSFSRILQYRRVKVDIFVKIRYDCRGRDKRLSP